jgi:A/G-specific adenine glycosylase
MTHLLKWYKAKKRELPWRQTTDPYKIWLSEIILQQTRVEQGLQYYIKFVEHFPTIFKLAEADIDKVLLLWQGLGYYSRARNLHETAKYIAQNLNGNFPEDFLELKKLKGIGDYTAAAIASFAFNKAHAVVDGNVYRVLSRYFAIDTPIDSSKGKKEFLEIANEVLNIQEPAEHNQGMMELGATVCIPNKPNCSECPLAEKCIAYNNNSMQKFPVKHKRTKQQKRFLYFLVIKNTGTVCIEKREMNDIWQGLYQFPCIETEKRVMDKQLPAKIQDKLSTKPVNYAINSISVEFKHILSHQILIGRFVHLTIAEPIKINGFTCIPEEEIQSYAMPRLITRYLEENGI